jgi:GNAT superfamily N-acetyltransferase
MPPLPPTLSIVPFSPEHREAFFELNRAWLEASFLIEPYDLKVLKQPEEMILDQGGAIYFGLLDGEAVATFALTPQGPGVVELNKMAVREDVQSQGIGQRLMHFMMAECRRMGVNVIELYSHSKLESALHIYRKFGFTDVALPEDCVYDRANVRMRLVLDPTTPETP